MTGFVVFTYLWAFSGLLDIAPFDAWFTSPFHALWAASCVCVLWRPRWLPAVAAMHALRIAAFVWDSPDTPNHQLAFAIVSATVLCSLPLAARNGGRRTPEAWLDAFAPLLRLELIVLYGFAVLHKLNRDYFDPFVSCGVNTFVGVAPAWLDALATSSEVSRYALIAGSLGVELSIPWLLAFGRTRRLGIAVGALFHIFLGLRFYAFSTGLLALYALFVPTALWESAAADVARRRARGGWAAWALAPGSVFAASVLLVAGFGIAGALLAEGPEWAAVPRTGFPLLGSLWIAGMLGPLAWLLLSARRAAGFAAPAPGRLARSPLLVAFPLLLLFHGCSPYLGLRTVPAFSMFSNLRTEGGLTNHWFMPSRALRVAGFQEDLVTVLAAEDEELLRFARRPRRTYWDFKLRIQRMAGAGKAPIAVTFRRGGELIVLEHAERDAELMAPIPWWQRKWLKFRPVPISTQRECSW